jgi:hypothetical protein
VQLLQVAQATKLQKVFNAQAVDLQTCQMLQAWQGGRRQTGNHATARPALGHQSQLLQVH